jgi:putative ABC transport system permease protein
VSPLDTIGFAFAAVARHRRRSLFSVMGMTIGVAAVVMLTALGEGAQRYVTDQFSSIGSNLLMISPGKTETTGGFPGLGGAPNDLTLDDARALQRELREASMVVPLAAGSETVAHRERRRQVSILGSTHEFLTVRELNVARGTFLPEGEMDRGAAVAVLGHKVARELFPNQSPLGKVVRVGDWRLRVIGVLAPRGRQIGVDIDDLVVIPVALAMRMFDRTSLMRVILKVRSHAEIDGAKQRVVEIIRDRHDEEDITVTAQDSIVSSLSKILTALTLAVGGIAAISLTVAGLGVMNLMLVSVSERTEEVGLLKALGARRRQVLWLFLTESVILAVAGAAAGVALGWAMVRVFVTIYPEFPATPPVWAIIAVVVTALGIGALFGVLPARRATDLDPVEALAGK